MGSYACYLFSEHLLFSTPCVFILIIKQEIINDNNTHLGSRMMDHLYFHFEHLKSTHINSVMNRLHLII